MDLLSQRSRIETLEVSSAAQSARGRALLQIWLSPSFPVGGYAYSHGLEKAVENGWVSDRPTLEAWLGDLIELGALRNDLILLAASWRASKGIAGPALVEVASLAVALQPSAERHLEATQQGASFIAQFETAWPADAVSWAAAPGVTPTLAVAVGFAAAAHEIGLEDALQAFGVAFIGALTSAAIRLSVVGQTDAQRVTAALLERVLSVAAAAARSTLDDLGGAAWRSDLASMQHETQHTRLFRS